MDHIQITFATLNRFCPLSKPPPPPAFNRKIKIKNACLFYIVFHYIFGTFYKKLQDTATSSFNPCCFTSALTPGDIIFYKFSELQNYLKKIFVTNFSFERVQSLHHHPSQPLKDLNQTLQKLFVDGPSFVHVFLVGNF